ncbi:hypothetical protein [Nitrosococcus watsonii]|uniref:Uncharacterized protein n=1 Tax=Nitrosococcus watsoni (strain C-113) TaxID=105559 RepID=D8KCD3_NITWC|nr:hypothetical protein [Nitrosococcus watsonii]ADJ29874.1 hypothetical protein Nwat_3157 [Nitrosococcus watsonii C-113]
MEVLIQGEGEVVIRLIDRSGNALSERKIRLSGSKTIQGKTELPLWLKTRDGQSSIAPVIVRAEESQKVQFEGEEAKTFTKKRCQDIGCSSTLIDDVLRGCVAPVQGEGVVAAKSEPVHRRSWWERWLRSEKKSS